MVFLFPSAKVLNFQGKFSDMHVLCFRSEPLKETQRYVVLATCTGENILLVWLTSLNFFFFLELSASWSGILKKKSYKK